MCEGLRSYIILAFIHLGLSGGLLAIAFIGTRNDEGEIEDTYTGPPFYIGAYIVGILQLIAGSLAGFMVWKSWKSTSGEVGSLLYGHMVTSILTLMGCFIAFVFAGISGLSTFAKDEETTNSQEYQRNRKMSYAIIGLCVAAIFTTILGCYLACNGGPERKTSPTVNTATVGASVSNTVRHPPPTTVSNQNNASEMELMRNQNRLLQEQVEIQRKMLEQQQQQQHQQQQQANMPPPAYSTVVSNPNFMTDPVYPPPQSQPSAPPEPPPYAKY